jgi:bacterioferritin-associated ferredoxin
MITAGEYEIEKIVAVWRNAEGALFVGAPCGRCREFMRQIDERNLDAAVVLGMERTVKLRELLPNHEENSYPTMNGGASRSTAPRRRGENGPISQGRRNRVTISPRDLQALQIVYRRA